MKRSMWFVWSASFRTSVKALVTQPCADGYSGWLGVVRSGVQLGSASVFGLPSMSACWIAVIGRQNR